MRRLCFLLAVACAGAALAQEPELAGEAEREFQEIVSSTSETSLLPQVARMEAWLAAHPSHPDVGRGQLWTAKILLWAGDTRRALELLEQVRRERAGSELATESELAIAAISLTRHDFARAQELYRLHARSGDDKWRYLARRGLDDVRRERALFWVLAAVIAAVAALTALRAWLIRRAQRAWWPLPEELVYPLPVLGLVLVASFSQPPEAALAVRIFALGAVLLLWANGAFLRARPPRGLARLREVALGLGHVVALLYCALWFSGLWAKFLETLESGVES